MLLRGPAAAAGKSQVLQRDASETSIGGIARQLARDLGEVDGRTTFAFVYAAAGLTCIYYLRSPEYPRLLLADTRWAAIGQEAAEAPNNNLYGLLWWVLVSVTFYFVLPALIVKLVQRRKLSEVGLALRIEPGFLKLLLVSIAIMLPLTYLMSLTSGFAAKYPFLHVYRLGRLVLFDRLVLVVNAGGECGNPIKKGVEKCSLQSRIW